ncbi:hypothetical protein CLF_108545, partial [Clonorchis sinensis]
FPYVRISVQSAIAQISLFKRRKADLREDVLLTCLISSTHRYMGSLVVCRYHLTTTVSLSRTTAGFMLFGENIVAATHCWVTSQMHFSRGLHHRTQISLFKRCKADLREDVLLTCLISSTHRYMGSLVVCRYHLTTTVSLSRTTAGFMLFGENIVAATHCWVTSQMHFSRGLHHRTQGYHRTFHKVVPESPSKGEKRRPKDARSRLAGILTNQGTPSFAATLPETSTRAELLPSVSSLDRNSRDARVVFEPRFFRKLNVLHQAASRFSCYSHKAAENITNKRFSLVSGSPDSSLDFDQYAETFGVPKVFDPEIALVVQFERRYRGKGQKLIRKFVYHMLHFCTETMERNLKKKQYRSNNSDDKDCVGPASSEDSSTKAEMPHFCQLTGAERAHFRFRDVLRRTMQYINEKRAILWEGDWFGKTSLTHRFRNLITFLEQSRVIMNERISWVPGLNPQYRWATLKHDCQTNDKSVIVYRFNQIQTCYTQSSITSARLILTSSV